MATGLVELIGSQIGSSGSNGGSGNTIAKVVDGDFTTFYDAANASNDWVGVDAGAACTVTGWKFAPRRGTSAITDQLQYESRMEGGKIQASSTADFSSDVTDCDTLTNASQYWSLNWNERSTTSPPSKRYWRYLGPASARCNIAELRFIANAGPSSAKPCQPTVSPWGGGYSTGNPTVTLASPTTSASLYYTTDGSTPDNSKTLYSGPFTLTVGSTTTLKVIAYDAGLGTTYSDVSTAIFHNTDFAPRREVYDTNRGILIQCHAGGVITGAGGGPLLVGGYYYRYGMAANRFNDVGGSPAWDAAGADGVWCYRSTDLVNWAFVGQVLTNPYPLEPDYVVERPHALFCAATSKYVLWAHVRDIPVTVNVAAIATADSPSGPWTWVDIDQDPDGDGYKDCNLFLDDDGKAYTIYKGESANTYISELSSDFTSTTGSPYTLDNNSQESPVLFKVRGIYTWLHGTQNYYDSTSTYSMAYKRSESLTSGWTSNQNFLTGEPAGGDFNAQPTTLLPYNGGAVYGGDFWVHSDIYSSRDVWLPAESYGRMPSTWNLPPALPVNDLLDGLVAYYPGNELTGGMLDAVGSLDLSTVIGSPGAFGVARPARWFTEGDDGFSRANNAVFQGGNIDKVWRIRVMPSAVGGYQFVFYKDGDFSSAREYGLYINNSPTRFTFYATNNGSTVVEAQWGSDAVANVWYDVVVWHDATNHQIGISVDGGTPVTSALTGGIYVGTSDFIVGRSSSGFSGFVSDLGIWNRAPFDSTARGKLYHEGWGLGYEDFQATPTTQAPAITSSASFSAAENQTAIGTATATGSPTPNWTLNGGADVASVAINSSTGVMTFLSAPNFEVKSIYTFGIKATNTEGEATQTVTVTVTNVNDVFIPPTITGSPRVGQTITAHAGTREGDTLLSTTLEGSLDGSTEWDFALVAEDPTDEVVLTEDHIGIYLRAADAWTTAGQINSAAIGPVTEGGGSSSGGLSSSLTRPISSPVYRGISSLPALP